MKKVVKIQQNSTLSEVEETNRMTGLSPIQEKAVSLLISGKTITDVSNELNIDRGTLYNWTEKINFESYYSKLCIEIKRNVKNELMSFYDKALNAILMGLQSDNESIKIKTAFWLFERLDSQTIGETDPRKRIKDLCYTNPRETPEGWGMVFDKSKYEMLCRENGIEPI